MARHAGWYPDPDGWGGQRYFDGDSWTPHRTPPVTWEPAPAWEAVTARLPVAVVAAPSGRPRTIMLGAVAAIVVLAVAGVTVLIAAHKSGGGASTADGPPSNVAAATSVAAAPPMTGAATAEETPTAQAPLAGIGQPVHDGDLEFVVTGVDRAPAVSDPQFPGVQKTAQGEYVLVRMKVTNLGSQPQAFFASFNSLSDGATQFRPDDEAWVYLGNVIGDINPGDSIDTVTVYDVPVGTNPRSTELHDGPFSEGVTVGL